MSSADASKTQLNVKEITNAKDFLQHCNIDGSARDTSSDWNEACMKGLNTILEERMGDANKYAYCATLFHNSNRDFGEYTACDAGVEYSVVRTTDDRELEKFMTKTFTIFG